MEQMFGSLALCIGLSTIFICCTGSPAAGLHISNFMTEGEFYRSIQQEMSRTARHQRTEDVQRARGLSHPRETPVLADGIIEHPLSGVQMSDLTDDLKTFGLVNVTTKGPATAFMLDLYRKLEHGDDISRATGHRNVDVAILRADTVRSLPASEAKHRHGSITLKFNLKTISRHEIAKRAELRLRLDQDVAGGKFRIKVVVYRREVKIDTLKYTTRAQVGEATNYAILDLTPLLLDIMAGGHENTTVEMRIRPKDRRPSSRRGRRSTHVHNVENEVNRPILVIYTKDKEFFKKIEDTLKESVKVTENKMRSSAQRHRRAASSGSRGHKTSIGRGLCNKKDFIVDFDELGWGNMIIHPKRFNAFYCSGRCPFPIEQSYDPTNHAMLQSLLRIGDDSVPRPCCVPTKLRALSVLYLENPDEYVVRHHKNMIVEHCGCR